MILRPLRTMSDSPTSDEGSSDLQLANNELKTPNSLDALVTIAQLPPSLPFPFAPITPLTKLSVSLSLPLFLHIFTQFLIVSA